MIYFDQLESAWDDAARTDMLNKICEGFDGSLDEFIDLGFKHFQELWDEAKRHHLLPVKRQQALDFGCGAARLEPALLNAFETVTGIDISPTMLAKAEEVEPRAEYVKMFPDTLEQMNSTFDFIVSVLTLQHIETKLAQRYVRSLFELLDPQGLMVIQSTVSLRNPDEGVTLDQVFRALGRENICHWTSTSGLEWVSRVVYIRATEAVAS